MHSAALMVLYLKIAINKRNDPNMIQIYGYSDYQLPVTLKSIYTTVFILFISDTQFFNLVIHTYFSIKISNSIITQVCGI